MGQSSTQLGQQGSNYGQYGNQPISPASPFVMNLNTDENKRVNDYNATTNIPSPQLPANIPNQNATWYPGMYPTNQPQFGTNAYSPQTFNVQGHPGDGHNPLGAGSTMPNQSMSSQGQMVKNMAIGGLSNIFGSNNSTGSLFGSLMPKTASSASSSTDPVVVNKFSPSQEKITHPSTVAQNLPISGKGPGFGSVLFNGAFNSNPELANAFGKGPASNVPEEVTTPPVPEAPRAIYQPTYAQYAPVNRMDTDSYGNPLFHNGGLTGE
jgi:hypothetical protein